MGRRKQEGGVEAWEEGGRGRGDEKKEGRVEGWEEGQQRQRDGGKKNCGAGVWEKGGQGMRREEGGQVRWVGRTSAA
jgi:hypothetical protein